MVRDHILSVDFPQEGKLRIRKVISRSKARPTGKYPSWKMGRMIHWESHHELNAYRLLDANPAVTSFHEQPLLIRFIQDGELYRHYPDVLVNLGSTRELWEVKPASEANKPLVAERTRLMECELSKMGFSYRMVNGEDLANEPRLSNTLTVLKYGRLPISIFEREQVRLLFKDTVEITWFKAGNMLGKSAPRLLSRLYLEGYLTCDMEQKLAPETKFRRT